MEQKTARGFTLIELLVVISIIGILAALTLTGFNAARKNARDAQRKSDLAQYRVILEAFSSNKGGRYPLPYTAPDLAHGSSCNNTGLFRSIDDPPIIPQYLPTKIQDPLEKSDCSGPCQGGQCTYRYRAYTSGEKYFLFAQLETGGYWILCSDGSAGRTTAWCDPGAGGDSYVDKTCEIVRGERTGCS